MRSPQGTGAGHYKLPGYTLALLYPDAGRMRHRGNETGRTAWHGMAVTGHLPSLSI